MPISWYRNKVAHVPKYCGAKWQQKVNRMSDSQVMALYFSFKKRGYFDKRKKNKEPTYTQLTLFDFKEFAEVN